MKNPKNKILETAWLAVAVLSLTVFIYDTWLNGFGKSYRFSIMFIFAMFVYLLRRKNRLNSNKESEP